MQTWQDPCQRRGTLSVRNSLPRVEFERSRGDGLAKLTYLPPAKSAIQPAVDY